MHEYIRGPSARYPTADIMVDIHVGSTIASVMTDIEVIIGSFPSKFVKYCPRSKTEGNILRTEGENLQ